MHVDMVQNLQTLPWSLPTRVQVSDVNQIFALLDYLIGSQVYSTHCQITLINQSEIWIVSIFNIHVSSWKCTSLKFYGFSAQYSENSFDFSKMWWDLRELLLS